MTNADEMVLVYLLTGLALSQIIGSKPHTLRRAIMWTLIWLPALLIALAWLAMNPEEWRE